MFTSLSSLLCCIMLLYDMSNSSPGTRATPTHIINSLCLQTVLEIEPAEKISIPTVPYFAKFSSSRLTGARLQRSQTDMHTVPVLRTSICLSRIITGAMKSIYCNNLPFTALTLLFWRRKGIRPVKKLGVDLFEVMI